MDIYIKHERGRVGTWSTDLCIGHVARNGRPLCKNGHPDGQLGGPISARGWRWVRGASMCDITCKSCRSRLDRLAIETSMQDAEEGSSQREPKVHWQHLQKIAATTSLEEAHLYLAWACASLLNEEEIMTYQQHRLFLPHQCQRLLGLLHKRQDGVPFVFPLIP
jgi:hypothetical protein